MSEGDAEWLAELAKAIGGDAWRAGDMLLEKFPAEQYSKGSAHTNLYAKLDEVHRGAHQVIGEDLSPTTMRIYRATADAWPPDTRVSRATFRAHAALRGREDRREVIERYIKRSEREKSVRLNHRQVRRYRAEESGRQPVVKSQQQKFSKALRSGAKRVLLGGVKTSDEHFWNASTVTTGEKEMLLREVEKLAAEIRDDLSKSGA